MESVFLANVERLRTEKGWSRLRLAKEAGISVDTLNAWASKGVSPTLRLVPKVAAALGVEPTDLMATGAPARTDSEIGRVVARPQRKAKVRVQHDHSATCPYEGCTTGLPGLEQFNGFCSAYCRVAEEQAKKGKR